MVSILTSEFTTPILKGMESFKECENPLHRARNNLHPLKKKLSTPQDTSVLLRIHIRHAGPTSLQYRLSFDMGMGRV